MNSPRFVMVVALAAFIGFISSSYVYANDSYGDYLKQPDVKNEIRSVIGDQEDNRDDDAVNPDIPTVKRFLPVAKRFLNQTGENQAGGNQAGEQVRTSSEFRGSKYYLLLVPPEETRDPIGIPAPEINDDIGITGEEGIRAKNDLLMKKLEAIKNRSEGK